jgi:hypothetical protein
MADNSSSSGAAWLVFALMTVVSWGVYGVFLHTGQTQMGGGDPASARYKAFLFVGIAYFLTAVLAPLALLLLKGAAFSGYTAKGMGWSLVAGIVGAIGAFGVLLAFGAGGKPGVVMSIVFAGAPVVNAIYSIISHPPPADASSPSSSRRPRRHPRPGPPRPSPRPSPHRSNNPVAAVSRTTGLPCPRPNHSPDARSSPSSRSNNCECCCAA